MQFFKKEILFTALAVAITASFSAASLAQTSGTGFQKFEVNPIRYFATDEGARESGCDSKAVDEVTAIKTCTAEVALLSKLNSDDFTFKVSRSCAPFSVRHGGKKLARTMIGLATAGMSELTCQTLGSGTAHGFEIDADLVLLNQVSGKLQSSPIAFASPEECNANLELVHALAFKTNDVILTAEPCDAFNVLRVSVFHSR